MNFMATSLNPFCSNRLIMSPMSPRCTPSGFTMMYVRSISNSVDIHYAPVLLKNATRSTPPIPFRDLQFGVRNEGHGLTPSANYVAQVTSKIREHVVSMEVSASPAQVPPLGV